MFDLDTLHYLNNQAVEEYRQSKVKPDTPIKALALVLRASRPPALSILLRLFDSAESYSEFVKLVTEYLPEREQDILSQTTPSAQMAAFASFFEDRYLPLHPSFKDGLVEDDYQELVRDIPVMVMGFGWEDYHELSDCRLGLQLMSFLFECPVYDGEGERVALADGFPEAYKSDAERLPSGGLKFESANRILQGKEWIGLKNWGQIISADTGNWFLDTDDEMRYSCELAEWDKETVELMVTDWKQAEAFFNAAIAFAAWLEDEEKGTHHFSETIDFILAHTTDEDFAG